MKTFKKKNIITQISILFFFNLGNVIAAGSTVFTSETGIDYKQCNASNSTYFASTQIAVDIANCNAKTEAFEMKARSGQLSTQDLTEACRLLSVIDHPSCKKFHKDRRKRHASFANARILDFSWDKIAAFLPNWETFVSFLDKSGSIDCPAELSGMGLQTCLVDQATARSKNYATNAEQLENTTDDSETEWVLGTATDIEPLVEAIRIKSIKKAHGY